MTLKKEKAQIKSKPNNEMTDTDKNLKMVKGVCHDNKGHIGGKPSNKDNGHTMINGLFAYITGIILYNF